MLKWLHQYKYILFHFNGTLMQTFIHITCNLSFFGSHSLCLMSSKDPLPGTLRFQCYMKTTICNQKNLYEKKKCFAKGPNKTTATLKRAKQNPDTVAKSLNCTPSKLLALHVWNENRYHRSKCLQLQGHQKNFLGMLCVSIRCTYLYACDKITKKKLYLLQISCLPTCKINFRNHVSDANHTHVQQI